LIDWCLTSSEQFFSYIQDDSVSWLWRKYIATILCTKLIYVYRTSLTRIIWSTGTWQK
jgi:hypothetical protein